MRRFFSILIVLIIPLLTFGQSATRLAEGWKFALGNAADPGKDFGRGTEYFNYLTKAASIHNEGPYVLQFDDSEWKDVRVPHDWAATLPYDSLASHSHGYKTIGWKYPETSVGWYRLRIPASAFREGRHYELRFDGIFRDANFWFNGFWMGHEPSGYAVQVYDITPYIDYGGENLLCVRADATFEEGWFYEGAGIYRPVRLLEKGCVYPTEGGIRTSWEPDELTVAVEIRNSMTNRAEFVTEPAKKGSSNTNQGIFVTELKIRLLDADGKMVCTGKIPCQLRPGETATFQGSLRLERPHFWDVEDPYLYTLETTVGEDVYRTQVGIRTAEFNATDGFLLNGRKVTLKGVNLHQDHAGVGTAMPDGLIEWRLLELMKYGVNAIRCSHHPASPALLDACDRLGILAIDENRLMGTNDYHRRQLENMVRFGAQHPSVILWSVGNEEWGLENDPRGVAIVREMQDYVHLLDPTRQTTAANAGGATLIEGLEVQGYNYIIQNDVEGRHRRHPEWIVYGSEETTGCGTRGVYALSADGTYAPADDGLSGGRMVSINRTGEPENVLERGWKYYDEHPWTGGVFWWTGFDYRGEANPLVYPAVGSEFGLLDNCGFPKDEAYYLKAWWTDDPVLHVFPHWNPSIVETVIAGQSSSVISSEVEKSAAGEEISPRTSFGRNDNTSVDVWVYSNAEEVELRLNGKSLGRKAMPENGHLVWKDVQYIPGKLVATGYKNGKQVSSETLETTGPATRIALSIEVIKTPDQVGGDDALAVVTARLLDAKGRFVPDACNKLTFTYSGPGRILGGGNGDPALHGIDVATDPRHFSIPAFNGLARILIALPSNTTSEPILLSASMD